MHHLLEVLFPYIVLFYVFDCFVYIKIGQTALSSHFGTGYRFKKPGFRFFGISPTSRLFISSNPSVYVSPTGIYLLKPEVQQDSGLYHSEAFKFFPFDTGPSIHTEGSLLKLDTRSTIDLYSTVLATQTAGHLRAVGELPKNQRGRRIEKWVRSQYDVTEIKDAWRASSPYFSLLGVMGTLLFVAAFILLPAILYIPLPIHLPFFLVWMMLIYAASLLISGIYVTRSRNPAEGGLYRILSFILSPATAAHPVHHFTKDLFYSYDILAVMTVFSRSVEVDEPLKKELKRLHFSILQSGNLDLTECLRLRKTCLTELLATAGMSPDDVLIPPLKSDPNAHSFCPLCETEFLEGVDACPDCGIRLETFDIQAHCMS